jgi:hypothetical protein
VSRGDFEVERSIARGDFGARTESTPKPAGSQKLEIESILDSSGRAHVRDERAATDHEIDLPPIEAQRSRGRVGFE